MSELIERLRDEWLRKATSSFTCQECGIQANFIDEIENALDAKDKQIAELEAGGWQPIETAPKDGTVVILYCPQGDGNPGSTYRVTVGNWWSSQDDQEPWEGWVSWDGGFSEDTMMPTLWQPLPAPPSRIDKEDRNG
ncbi:MAG: hypothetical protein LCH86_09935 [Proteobacteria bacterium]|nr:hypothetical protein [Pseudomonadota bacterium]